MTPAVIFFYLFDCALCLSAFVVITARNPVHSMMFLILAFVASAGLFLLIGAQFLSMLQVVVYVCAVAVLFPFVVRECQEFRDWRGGLTFMPSWLLLTPV
ncbi:MAG: NADH-quinone oxidoreductase subunit J [Hyphomicrobiales bacterium]|nr:NADH-quinone oxidoreductase subunit J [Hyphomicrobiales bacterium]MDE2114419.1 NADH-quinone oxidoreductase subunit J [Hyphomicrobiales bacterium]